MSNVEDLIQEVLRRIQQEQSTARDRHIEVLQRLSSLETAMARLNHNDVSNYDDIIHNRHELDKVKERIERIEAKLLSGN